MVLASYDQDCPWLLLRGVARLSKTMRLRLLLVSRVLAAVPTARGGSEASQQAPQKAGVARIDGARADDYAGFAVAGMGDVNGDGNPDVVVGGGRSVYVVFGRAGMHNGDLAALNARGFRINVGPENNKACSDFSIAGAGDVNGDGRADVLVRVTYGTGHFGSG